MVTLTRSVESGFSRKSKAPRRVASTAVLTVPCPDIITTGNVSSRWRIRRSTSRPSIPGILTSRNTISGGSAAMRASPSSPPGAGRHS